jgi:4-alpha-glucanotransferase
MPFPRATGILLHPTSLPSCGGIGDFGPEAYAFVDFLAKARQGLWQVLPLGPLGYGNSPYSSTSAFAGNPLLISLDRLADHGWIERSRLSHLLQQVGDIDYDQVRAHKLPLLDEAAGNFLRNAPSYHRDRFDRFCKDNEWWLDDFVLFDHLRDLYRKDSWNLWPRDLARRESPALERARSEHAASLAVGKVIQFAFWEQWHSLRRYCASKSVRVVGDIAIFVNYDSADVWTNPQEFRLDQNLDPEVVAGVPPDAFSETGQRWGSPLYRWDLMRERGFAWWTHRLRWATQTCDYIRLDHFRGFEQCWEIPAHEPTAVHGRWVDGPKDDFFHHLRRELGGLPFFAEDLGYITEAVHALRHRHQIPGMAVLQFGFNNPGAHIYLPHRLTPHHVVYTGTHDNDTTVGWWSCCEGKERHDVQVYLGDLSEGIHWALIRAAQSSVATLSVAPLQDVLGLGSEARMNKPSHPEGNWQWRFQPEALCLQIAERLALLAEVTDRIPQPCSVPSDEPFSA